MVRKIKTVEVKEDNVSYDDIVESVSKPEPEVVEEVVAEEHPVEITPEMKEDVKEEPTSDKKPKKEMPMATCDGCGKTMTVKNLKYAHRLICPAVLSEEVVEAPPPPPILKRSESVPPSVGDEEEIKPKPKAKSKNKIVKVDEEVNEIPPVQKKTKQTRVRKVSESKTESAETIAPAEPVVMKKSRAVIKAEKYSALAANALP